MIKKRFFAILVLTVLLICVTSQVKVYGGNPYGLFGFGNCCKLTYTMIEKFWPMTPDIPGCWDACKWSKLEGYEKDGYRIDKVTDIKDVRPGDIYVSPGSPKYPRGHVSMVVSVQWSFNLETSCKQLNFTVVESNMYAMPGDFPKEYQGCLYREEEYPGEYLWDTGVLLRCDAIDNVTIDK